MSVALFLPVCSWQRNLSSSRQDWPCTLLFGSPCPALKVHHVFCPSSFKGKWLLCISFVSNKNPEPWMLPSLLAQEPEKRNKVTLTGDGQPPCCEDVEWQSLLLGVLSCPSYCVGLWDVTSKDTWSFYSQRFPLIFTMKHRKSIDIWSEVDQLYPLSWVFEPLAAHMLYGQTPGSDSSILFSCMDGK